LRILHIEDSAADQALARLSLLRGGLVCEIVAVDMLDDAAAALQNQAFDLILADYHLPGFTARGGRAGGVRAAPGRPDRAPADLHRARTRQHRPGDP
jgi:CheY-like chemotaxis protein